MTEPMLKVAPSGWVLAVAVLPDGRVVSASSDKTLRVWEPNNGCCLVYFEFDFPLACVAVVDEIFVVGDQNGDVHFLDRIES